MTFDFEDLYDSINDAFIPYLKDKHRYMVMYGSAGSGKSHAVAQKFLVRIMAGMKSKKIYKVLALRKTQPDVRKSVFALFKTCITLWKFDKFVKINDTKMTITFINGSQIMCGGLDNREKLKSIEGITDAWLEEATEFDREDFQQVDLRVRAKSGSYNQIAISFNPISKLFWVHPEFFTQKYTKEQLIVMHSTYKDNKFLSAEYIATLKSYITRDPAYYKIYALGEWGALEDVVYNNWDIVPNGMPAAFNEEAYCIDFGFNNPCTINHIREVDGTEIYVDELLHETGLTNSQLIERMRLLDVPKDVEIFADSASPEKIAEIADAGYKILGSIKGKDSVLIGIDIVKRHNLHLTKRSIHVKMEIQAYAYKKDKNGDRTDDPIKFHDHHLDPLRYTLRYWWVRNNDWKLGESAPANIKKAAPDQTEKFRPKGVPLIDMMKKQTDIRVPGNSGFRGNPPGLR